MKNVKTILFDSEFLRHNSKICLPGFVKAKFVHFFVIFLWQKLYAGRIIECVSTIGRQKYSSLYEDTISNHAFPDIL